MKTYHPTSQFAAPAHNSGQIVDVSYAYDADAEVIIERRVDSSDGTVEYTAYADGGDEEWEPQNCAPTLGRKIGPCQIGE